MAAHVLAKEETAISNAPARTVLGWQGVRFVLPPEWNMTGFSMDRESGYIRADAPGQSALTVQIRWTQAGQPEQKTVYHVVAPLVRKWLRKPAPPAPKVDLKASLEKILKDTAKQAKKAKSTFESSSKPEKIEGEDGERTAINFSWSGEGRGQGKIWHCTVCNRILVAQVVGLAKDGGAIGAVASQLFSTLQDHAVGGYDRWALYDLQADIPEDFKLEEQKLLSGYLRLVFQRGAERIVIDRWGLANMALKKFTLAEWLRNHALARLKRMAHDEFEGERGHTIEKYTGKLSLLGTLKALRDGRGGLRRLPTRYTGGVWLCEESNKIYAVQTLHNPRSEELWAEVAARCGCH